MEATSASVAKVSDLEIVGTKDTISGSTGESNPYYHLTFGSFNRKDERFGLNESGKIETSVCHSHCMVIVAWMYHYQYKPFDWNANHLDNIICKGDWLYFLFRSEPRNDDDYKKCNKDSAVFLASIRVGTFTHKHQYLLEPPAKLAFFGNFTGLRTKLNNYMNTCDESFRCILFTCKQISFGIFAYNGRDGAVEYCLFDPHGRNKNGFFDYTANSCVLYFKTIDNLVDLLARDGIFAYSRYECVPLKPGPLTNKVHGVNVHNSRRFVNGYVDGTDGWRDTDRSSESSFDSEDYDDFESDDDEDDGVELPLNKPVLEKTSSRGRIIKAKERYTCEPHKSFFRGKAREDLKRQNANWKQWYDSKDLEQKRKRRSLGQMNVRKLRQGNLKTK